MQIIVYCRLCWGSFSIWGVGIPWGSELAKNFYWLCYLVIRTPMLVMGSIFFSGRLGLAWLMRCVGLRGNL